MTTTATSTECTRWGARLAQAHERLADAVAAFGGGEIDWAPDTGIDDARSILWAMARRERRLVRLLESRRAGESERDEPHRRVDVGEMLRLLEATHGRLTAWLDCAADEDLQDVIEAEATAGDLLCDHLAGLTEGITRMRALVQLIDPDRVTADHWIA